jgi:O-antigen/teichoic acid export membrane protein
MTVSLFKNFLSLTGAEAFSKLITFAAFAYLARIFGPAGFGYIEWAAAVLMCASLIVDQGFSAYGAREIAKEPSRTPALVAEIVTARLLLAAIGYAAIVIFALFFVHEQLVVKLLLTYGLSVWALPLLLQWVFQGHDRMNLVALTQIIRQMVFVAVVLFFVREVNDLLFVGFAEVAGVVLAAVFSVWMYKRYFADKLNLRPILSGKLFREAVPIGVSQIFWVIRMFGSILIIGLVATAEDTGFFAGAMRILIALHTFIWLYYFNMLPSMSRAWMDGREQFAELIRKSMRIVALASIGVGVIWFLAAPLVMTSVYGPGFSNGGGALQWMAGVWVAAAISGHYRFGLIAAGQQNREMLSSALGAVAAIIFIPLGYLRAGPGGAAAAVCFAEIVVLISSWFFARRSLFLETADPSPTAEKCIDYLQEVVR